MKYLISALSFIFLLSACKGMPDDVLTGELKMNPLKETGYRELEIRDSDSKTTKQIQSGRYQVVLSSGLHPKFIVKDLKGNSLANVSLKEAKFRDSDNRFFMSVQKSNQPLDIYGGRRKNVTHKKRVGRPDQPCTIHCCTTTHECDTKYRSDGTSYEDCQDVCHDCTGRRDELWQTVDFRYDYEIFFGKPGDFEVGSFTAAGQNQRETEILNTETCTR